MTKKVPGPPLPPRPHKHDLYQRSVQDVHTEAAHIRRFYKDAYPDAGPPRVLREDFCGTALLSCQWVKGHPDLRAIGVDLDAETLKWGTEHNLNKLAERHAARVTLVEADVFNYKNQQLANVVHAGNFSYFCIKERAQLIEYFRCSFSNLDTDGILVLDSFGGSEVLEDESEEETEHDGFTYVWDQAAHDPISGDYLFHIHFDFPDGKRLKKAFTYDWRLWSVPEIRDCLHEAGFSRVNIYWDIDDEPQLVTKGINDAAWLAYIVAVKD